MDLAGARDEQVEEGRCGYGAAEDSETKRSLNYSLIFNVQHKVSLKFLFSFQLSEKKIEIKGYSKVTLSVDNHPL